MPEESFEYLAVYNPPPGQGYTRYATSMLHRVEDRRYWTDNNACHHYVIDDYGYLKHVKSEFSHLQ